MFQNEYPLVRVAIRSIALLLIIAWVLSRVFVLSIRMCTFEVRLTPDTYELIVSKRYFEPLFAVWTIRAEHYIPFFSAHDTSTTQFSASTPGYPGSKTYSILGVEFGSVATAKFIAVPQLMPVSVAAFTVIALRVISGRRK